MIDTGIIEVLRRKFTRLKSDLNERGRRRWAASEALELGHGGLTAVAQATGGREAGATRSRPMILPWSPPWKRWWTRRPGASRCRRDAGPARVHGHWPRRWRARGIR